MKSFINNVLVLGFAAALATAAASAQTIASNQAVGAGVVAGDSSSSTSTPSSSVPATPAAKESAGKGHDDSFVIGSNDMLAISVWKQPDLSRSVPVRSDGRISLPLIGEVQAAGRTPMKLEKDIATKLEPFLTEPEVTVIVEQINSDKFNILGRVSKPGTYSMTDSTTVLDAIALAGGFRDFAKQKSVYVLRQNPDGTQTKLPFNYREVIQGKNTDQNIKLQRHDTIVVP
jgi:polysaccharide export outer membrane protein